MENKGLKLNATSVDDLKVLSAHLQDSITQVKNIAHLKRNRIFLIQFNRFMWEDIEKGVFRKNKRILSVLKFENVVNVNSKNLNQKNSERFLDFLAMHQIEKNHCSRTPQPIFDTCLYQQIRKNTGSLCGRRTAVTVPSQAKTLLILNRPSRNRYCS